MDSLPVGGDEKAFVGAGEQRRGTDALGRDVWVGFGSAKGCSPATR